MDMHLIGDCFPYIKNGANIRQDRNKGGYPITRIETISQSVFNRDRMGYADVFDLDSYSDRILEDGDILMSHINSIPYLGRSVMYVSQPGESIIHGMNLLRLKADRGLIEPGFAVIYFNTTFFKTRLMTIVKKAVNQASYSIRDLKKLSIPCPNLAIQREIISYFDAINNRRQQLMRMSELLDNLVKSRFVEMFGTYNSNPEKRLQDVSEFVTVGIANAATHAYADSGVVMLRNLNVRENYLDDGDLVYIKPEFAAKYRKKALKTNDILVTRTGYPGIACIVPAEYEGCQTFTTLIVRLKEAAPVTSEYISQLINSPLGKEFVERMKAGSSQQNFGATSLKQMPVGTPPLSSQHEFAAFVRQVDKSQFAVQQSIEQLELLKEKLEQEYFS